MYAHCTTNQRKRKPHGYSTTTHSHDTHHPPNSCTILLQERLFYFQRFPLQIKIIRLHQSFPLVLVPFGKSTSCTPITNIKGS